MRERPRAEILPGQTLMLGGSVVEGWELELGHTIGRSLEARSGSSKQFLNGGLRFTGPVLQSALLSKYAQRYSPREVVWVLAENDIDDDRLFFSLGTKRDADETPIEFSTADFDFVAPLVRLRDSIGGIGGLMNAVIGKLYYWNVARLIERSDEKHFRVCAGIDRGLAVARQKKIRVVFLVLSSGPNLPPRKNRENFDQLLACTKGHPLLDLRGELRDQKQLFLESDTHLNELGVDVVTSKILLAHVL